MDNDRYQIIPRKKMQLLYPIMMGIVYIGAFYIISSDFQYEISYFIIGFLVLFFGFTFLDFLFWRLNWQKLGEETGFIQEEKSLLNFIKVPDLSGSYRGYQFNLSIFTIGYGRSKKYYTKINMEIPFNIDGDFLLKKKSFIQQNLELTGIEEFDKKFYLNTESEWVKNRLFQNREIKDGLFDILKQSKTMNLSLVDNQLSHYERTRIKDIKYLLSIMDFLIKMAGVFRQNNQ